MLSNADGAEFRIRSEYEVLCIISQLIKIQSLDLPNMKHACIMLLSASVDLLNECNQKSYKDL